MAEELDYQELEVFEQSMEFVGFVDRHMPDRHESRHAVELLDQASARLPTHIAKGASAPHSKRSSQLQEALEAALECASNLDVLAAQDLIDRDVQTQGKQILQRIITGLKEDLSGHEKQPSQEQQDPVYRVGDNHPDQAY